LSPSTPTDLSALSPLADELATMLARVASDIALVIDADGVIRTVAEGQTPLSPAIVDWVGRRCAPRRAASRSCRPYRA